MRPPFLCMKAKELQRCVTATLHFDKDRQMKLDNMAFAIAEDMYETQFGRPDAGIDVILRDLVNRKQRAIMAISYAGLKRANSDLTWEAFCGFFSLSGFEGLTKQMIAMVGQTLPDEEDAVTPKNA